MKTPTTKVNNLDAVNDKSESVGQSFFRVFVDKKVEEELEIDKDNLVITKEESNSRIILLLSILGCIEVLFSSALVGVLIHANMEDEGGVNTIQNESKKSI